jgi:FMN phosphatase YigB (HAD superfamily)
MVNNCQTPDRNMCAPDGKLAVLFVDIDGTVMVCQKYFDGAMNEFAQLMSLSGFDRKEAHATLNQIYYGSMPHRGFERGKFGQAIAEAYTALCRRHKVRRQQLTADICERIGRAPFFNAPELFEYALPVLTRARHNFMMVAVTVGNREAQKYKIRQGGLSSVFDDIIITLQENKAGLVCEFIEDMGVSPQFSAFIGNSIRSDGAALSKTNFVYLPLESSLTAPTDKLPVNTGFQQMTCKDWLDVEESAINRLIRRRRQAIKLGLPGPSAPAATDRGCCGGRQGADSLPETSTGSVETTGTDVD